MIFSRDKDKINQLIDKLKNKEKLDLADEGDVEKYLGVEIERNKEDKSISFKQTFLIQRAIELAGLRDSNKVDIPAVKPPLGKDLEGASRTSTWEYRSIIGLLNYISGSSRPEIAYTTHSSKIFSANPKASHDKGVKSIIKYLKGTKENGLIMYTKNDKGLECFVDAYFTGGWSTNESDDPASVYSCT